MNPKALPWLGVVAYCCLVLACGDFGSDSGWSQDEDAGYSDGGDGADGSGGGTDGTSSTSGMGGTDGTYDDGLGSEDEASERLLTPAATPRHVFIANPDRDTVSRVSSADLSVVTVPVGLRPAALAATPDGSTAVVLNLLSEDLTLIDAETLSTRTVDVRPDLNAVQVSPDGRWAAAYFAQSAVDDEDPESTGAQSYNEVSLVKVDDGSHHPLVVGFSPSSLAFTPDGARALVVSDAWLAVLDLSGSAPEMMRVRLSDDTIDPPEAEEVEITPDGRFAFIRQYALDTLKVVDLATGNLQTIAVGGNPTDLDLSPDGSLAYAVCRTVNQLWIYQTADPSAAATVVDLPSDEVFGSLALSADGSTGLLYSTQSGRATYGSIDLDGDLSLEVRALVKPVEGVLVSPSGGTGVLFHNKSSDGAAPDTPFRHSWALTLVDLETQFSNPIQLAGEPIEFIGLDDGSAGAFIMEDQDFLEIVHYDTLLFDEVPLRSQPEHVGAFPGTRSVWVSQQHELGRISFYDVTTSGLQTITGFELNSEIEN